MLPEPDFNYVSALLPYQPVSMRVRYCPIDPRLDFSEINKLLSTIHPKHLIIPTHYSSQSRAESASAQKYIQPLPRGRISHYSHLDALKIPLERAFEKAILNPDLAMHLTPKASIFADNALVANVSAILSVRDHQIELKAPSWVDIGVLERSKKRDIWGKPLADKLVQSLLEEGITGVRVERKLKGQRNTEMETGEKEEGGNKGEEDKENKEKFILYVDVLEAAIILVNNRTKIRTGAEDVRTLLKNIVLKQCMDLSQLGEEEQHAPSHSGGPNNLPPVISID